MGTVTAIGGAYDPDRQSTGTISSSIFTYPPTASVYFDDWRTAADFAALIAGTVGRVTVRKLGVQWCVTWVSTPAPVTPPRHPQWPPYPYITYTAGGSA